MNKRILFGYLKNPCELYGMKKFLISLLLLICCVGLSMGGFAQSGLAAKFSPNAKRGVAYDLNGLAGCYEYGYGVDVNYLEALRLHKEAAFRGSSESTFRIGALHKYGFGGIKQDYELAFKYLSEASNEGCDGANPYLAEFYENGVYVGKDMQQAIKYFYLSGKYYFDKAKKCERLAGIDSASAPKSEIEGYLKYAEGPDDDARAMYALSQVYLFGLNDVEKNSELGMEWLKKAADKGLTIAMSELGDYLISKDEYEEAIKLLEVCSLKGHQMSMKNLAQAYRILEIRGKTIAEGVIPNLYIAAGDFETLRKYYPSLSRATDAELLNKQILIFQGIHQGDSRPAASQSSTNKPATNQSPVNQPPVYYPPVQQNNNYNQHQNNNQQRQPMRVLCQHCNGTGYICVVKSVPTYGTHSNVKTRCKNCSQLLDHGIVHVQKKCYHCQGKGYIEK